MIKTAYNKFVAIKESNTNHYEKEKRLRNEVHNLLTHLNIHSLTTKPEEASIALSEMKHEIRQLNRKESILEKIIFFLAILFGIFKEIKIEDFDKITKKINSDSTNAYLINSYSSPRLIIGKPRISNQNGFSLLIPRF